MAAPLQAWGGDTQILVHGEKKVGGTGNKGLPSLTWRGGEKVGEGAGGQIFLFPNDGGRGAGGEGSLKPEKDSRKEEENQDRPSTSQHPKGGKEKRR